MTRAPSSSPVRSAVAYVTRQLRDADQEIEQAAARVLSNADDEAIHDLRVAIRRLRTLLKMSRRLYGRWHTDAVRRAYADVMKRTGDLRDEEVLEETLEGASDAPAFIAWLGSRKAREKRLRRAVTSRLERGDLDRARLLLKALLVFPIDPDREQELGRFARKTVERARREVERRRDAPPDDAAGLHELRIAYKELRYSIDLLGEALPLDARAMLEPAVVFQKRLGEIHDVDVAMATIEGSSELEPAVRADVLGRLREKREKRLGKYLKELDPLEGASKAGSKAAPAAADVAEEPVS